MTTLDYKARPWKARDILCVSVSVIAACLVKKFCVAEQDCIEADDWPRGLRYRGKINVTISRLKATGKNVSCQRWTAQSPNTHIFGHNPSALGASTVAEVQNYCRNVNNNEKQPWCYITRPADRRGSSTSRLIVIPNVTDVKKGQETRWQYCYVPKCIPEPGNWSPWRKGLCSLTCGNGERVLTRTCSNPAPKHGGQCEQPLLNKKTEVCHERNCPTDGKWTEWELHGHCTKTCGGGKRSIARSCTNPPPQYGGKDCPGEQQKFNIRECNTLPCPVIGFWGEWKEWGACSHSCGFKGVRRRERQCDNPRPKYHGHCINDLNSEEESCSRQFCPIDGIWSTWLASPCSASCGQGTQIMSRICTAPMYGGRPCMGNKNRRSTCLEIPCPVDGGWSPWSITICSATCGVGLRRNSRSCTYPLPQFNGKPCEGATLKTDRCILDPCPAIDGGWTAWYVYRPCDAKCGSGAIVHVRNCTHPLPRNGGQKCGGHNVRISRCDVEIKCKVLAVHNEVSSEEKDTVLALQIATGIVAGLVVTFTIATIVMYHRKLSTHSEIKFETNSAEAIDSRYPIKRATDQLVKKRPEKSSSVTKRPVSD